MIVRLCDRALVSPARALSHVFPVVEAYRDTPVNDLGYSQLPGVSSAGFV